MQPDAWTHARRASHHDFSVFPPGQQPLREPGSRLQPLCPALVTPRASHQLHGGEGGSEHRPGHAVVLEELGDESGGLWAWHRVRLHFCVLLILLLPLILEELQEHLVLGSPRKQEGRSAEGSGPQPHPYHQPCPGAEVTSSSVVWLTEKSSTPCSVPRAASSPKRCTKAQHAPGGSWKRRRPPCTFRSSAPRERGCHEGCHRLGLRLGHPQGQRVASPEPRVG